MALPVELTDAELERQVTLVEIDSSPATFAEAVTRHESEPWIPYEYLKLINRALLRLVDKSDPMDRLLVTIPYRHGKSVFMSRYFPAWFLNKYPNKRVILASYADEFAERWGRECRQVLEQNAHLLKARVSKASSAANRWDIEGTRGGMKTAGVGGQIVGWGADLWIIDDPHKDAEEAYSLLQRDSKWRWWNTAAQSRLEPGASVVVIGTRWHEDDFIGRLLLEQRDRWYHINLPAICEGPGDPLGRKPGEALCPQRYDENALAVIKQDITPDSWLAGYQQRPTPEGGGRFKEADFRLWELDETGVNYRLLPGDHTESQILVPVSDCGRFVTVDTALSLKTSADYTVVGVWDVASWTSPSKLILHDRFRARLEGADHLHMLTEINNKFKPVWIGVEETALSMTLISQALRAGLPIRRLKPERDKYGRSETAVIMLQNHRVYFPKRAGWYPEWRHELLSFPAGQHDDQVDVFSYAAREFASGYGGKARPREPESMDLGDRIWAQLRRGTKKRYDHPMLGDWRN